MDDSDLRRQVQSLADRVARLEAQLRERGAAPAPAAPAAAPDATVRDQPPPRPAAPPPGVPDQPPPSAAARPPAAKDRDLERFVGLMVLGRVGIAAVLLAAAWFGQLGWTRLGPAARTALVYAFGLALVGLGAWLRPRVQPRYTALLWGGGVAATYLGGVLGHLRYALFGDGAALLALLASAALAQALAARLGLQAFATVALGGAYAAPVLVGSPQPEPTAFFALLLALHGWAALTEARWQWRWARALAVVATAALAVSFYAANGCRSISSAVLHGHAIWLGLAAPELWAGWRGRAVGTGRAVAIGVAAVGLEAALLALCIHRDRWPGYGMVAAPALLAAGALWAPRARELGRALAMAGALLLPFGAVWQVSGSDAPGRVAWAMGCVTGALYLARRFTHTADAGAALAALFAYLAALGDGGRPGHLATTALAVVAPGLLLGLGRSRLGRWLGLALLASAWWSGFAPPASFAGPRGEQLAAALAGVGAAAAWAGWWSARRADLVLAWLAAGVQAAALLAWLRAAPPLAQGAVGAAAAGWPFANLRTGCAALLVGLCWLGRRAAAPAAAAPRAMLGATGLVAVFLAGLAELLDFAAGWPFGARAVATSLYGLGFAGVLLLAGFRRGEPALRWVALGGFGIVAVKVLAHDLREVDTELRVLASGVVGAVLLLGAWGYARVRQA